MRKSTKGLAALIVGGCAVAVPLLAPPANAATSCVDMPTTTGPATFHATQPSGGGGNWDHTIRVTVNSDGGFTGTNEIIGLDAGQEVTVTEQVSGSITDKDRDGISELTMASVRDSGFYTFEWSVTDAPMNGQRNSMNDGTVSYATALDWQGGDLPITFTAPVFDNPTTRVCTTTPDEAPVAPVIGKDNHGEFVSDAAHAGVKGKDLAEIAKDRSLVGSYDPTKVPAKKK